VEYASGQEPGDFYNKGRVQSASTAGMVISAAKPHSIACISFPIHKGTLRLETGFEVFGTWLEILLWRLSEGV
jgi:hypothetical protein